MTNNRETENTVFDIIDITFKQIQFIPNIQIKTHNVGVSIKATYKLAKRNETTMNENQLIQRVNVLCVCYL